MPRVQYSHPSKGVNEYKPMVTPKNVESLDAWVKQARKIFPEAPTNFTLSQSLVTTGVICLQYVSNKHDKFALVIDRRG